MSCTKDVWHQRLGHPSSRVLRQILKLCSISDKSNERGDFCEACKYGKAHRLPYQASQFQANKPLELIHSDLWGPAPLQSTNGFQYYVAFLDDDSRFTWIYRLKSKGKTSAIFLQFKNLVENLYSTTIKTLRCDGGGEFKPVIQIAQNQRIAIQVSCLYTSAQNNRIERNIVI